jgi:DNA-binding GntR family transcriptional regulator
MRVTGIKKPKRSTTTEQAYNTILSAIVDGTIPPGSPLRLQDLAESLGMSMMPVREALRQLESIGVIETIPHRGARVCPVSPEDLEDTYLTRIVQEGILVRIAAPLFDDAAAEDCEAALDEQQNALDRGDLAAARLAHERFHFRIYEAAGSKWLLRSLAAAWHNSERYRAASTADPATVRSRRHEHERILDACVKHDAEAAQRALEMHLLSTVEGLDAKMVDQLKVRLRNAIPAREVDPVFQERTALNGN